MNKLKPYIIVIVLIILFAFLMSQYDFFKTLFWFVIILGITIFIHELGHFIFAKRAKIHVYEFAIGMGPKLFSWNRKNDETIYTVRAFPIGGYVQMAGEEIDKDENIPADRTLQSKSWLDRFLTIVAGVVFNFILAIVLLFVVSLIAGAPNNKPIITDIHKDFPIAGTNLKAGDQIISVDGKRVSSIDKLLLELHVHKGKSIDVVVKDENGNTKNITMEPKKVVVDEEETYQYGFVLDNSKEKGFLPSIQYAFTKTYSLMEQMFFVIGALLTGSLALNNLAGPVGIFGIVGDTAASGLLNLLYLAAFFSINVGFINLLPFPAFDGGRLVFLFIEKIKGSPVDSKIENIIHTIGFILLMILMIFITFNDILRVFN